MRTNAKVWITVFLLFAVANFVMAVFDSGEAFGHVSTGCFLLGAAIYQFELEKWRTRALKAEAKR